MGGERETGEGVRFDAEHASAYDRQIRFTLPGYDALHETAAGLLAADLGPRGRLLVVGAGTGEEIVRLGGAHPDWTFVGVDPSEGMLAVAERRVQEVGIGERVDLRLGFVDLLPVTERYDGATMLLVMHFLRDDGAKLALLRSVADRLAEGAPVLLADLSGEPGSAGFERFLAAWRQRQRALGMPEHDIAEMFRRIASDVHPVTEDRFRHLCVEAGLEAVQPFFRSLLFAGWVARKGAEC